MTILVVGATGKTGRLVVEQLLAKNRLVRTESWAWLTEDVNAGMPNRLCPTAGRKIVVSDPFQ